MASSLPAHHEYHPPRHPHAFTPTPNPHYTPRSSTSTYYASSSTSTQQIPFYSTGPPSTISTNSSITPPARTNPGLAAARHVTKVATRLQKRARSGQTHEPEAVEDIDEGFFSGPGSPPPPTFPEKYHSHYSSKSAHRARGKIKPLLKKVSGSRGNSLDLSRSDGGLPNGVGLGIYDSTGYDSSGLDDDASNRHRRNFSSASGNSPLIIGGNQSFSHPKRQVPRRGAYTPDISHHGTSNENSDDSSDDEQFQRRTRTVILQGSSASPVYNRGLRLNTEYAGRSTPMLPTGSMTDLHQREQESRSPSTPIASPTSVITPVTPSNKSMRPSYIRGRSSTDTTSKTYRDTSPSFAASVTAARLAWEAKEERKEEKREAKRRRSEAKEDERSRAASRCSARGRVNSGSSSNDTQGTSWDPEEQGLPVMQEKPAEHEIPIEGELPGDNAPKDKKQYGTGKRWGVTKTGNSRPGLKKRWQGFVLWVRIGMVRLGRKMGF